MCAVRAVLCYDETNRLMFSKHIGTRRTSVCCIGVCFPHSLGASCPCVTINVLMQRHAWFKDIDWDLLMGRKVEPPWTPSLRAYTKVLSLSGNRSPTMTNDARLKVCISRAPSRVCTHMRVRQCETGYCVMRTLIWMSEHVHVCMCERDCA